MTDAPTTPTLALPKLRRGTLVYLEAELRDYRATRRALRETEADIALGGLGVAYDGKGGSGGGKRSTAAGHGDPTGQRATRLAQYALLAQMRRVCAAVEELLGMLPREQKQALALLYWHLDGRLSPRRVAEAIPIDESTLRRWRRLWLALLAARLGLH